MTDRVALVLEDEALIAMDVSDALMAKGYSAATVGSSDAARHWLSQNPPPDVAVIDVGLSDGPAHQAAAQLVRLAFRWWSIPPNRVRSCPATKCSRTRCGSTSRHTPTSYWRRWSAR